MLDELIARIQAAHAAHTPLLIQGGGSKSFYGNPCAGEVLDTRTLTGIVDYQPKELVLTARAGTPLAEIETALARHNQMLAFEPPHFTFPHPNPPPLAGEGATVLPKPIYATLGGCVATGLSGPRRPYTGAVRDYVLGVRMIDGTGQALRFGGQVIKNVAGYDVSRLMVGSLGTLGVITEVSLKVLPRPVAEISLQFEMSEVQAIETMNRWAGQPLPLSATSWHAGLLNVRLSGAQSAVNAAHAKLGGEVMHDAPAFWQRLRDHSTPFFNKRPLWRLAVQSTHAALGLDDGAQWVEWGGAVRWVAADLPTPRLRQIAREAGGHASLFRGEPVTEGVFSPLTPALLTVHQNLKQRFDPRGILNRGRLYPDF